MGIFSRAQRYEQTFRLRRRKGLSRLSVLAVGQYRPALQCQRSIRAYRVDWSRDFRLPYGNEHDLDWRYGFVRDGRSAGRTPYPTGRRRCQSHTMIDESRLVELGLRAKTKS